MKTGYEDRDVPDWAEGPERGTLSRELRDAVQAGLQLIPPDLRAAVVLRDIQELTNTEAADALEITVTALKARLHRGRVLLRKHLEQYIHS
jgi:RNA polymerase sigma-70 factor (ECF subfamily)